MEMQETLLHPSAHPKIRRVLVLKCAPQYMVVPAPWVARKLNAVEEIKLELIMIIDCGTQAAICLNG